MILDNHRRKGLKGRALGLLVLVLFLTSCGSSALTEQTTTWLPANSTEETTTQGVAEQVTQTSTPTEDASTQERTIDPALAGRYVCSAIYWQGENGGADDSWYELREDGTGMAYTVFEWELTWSLDGDAVVMIDGAGVETWGTIDGDTLTVEDKLLDRKCVYSRKVEGDLPTESTADLQAPASTETIVGTTQIPSLSTNITEENLYDYWNRGWYGWWVVEEGSGVYGDWGNGSYWWDCCADIVMEGNDILRLSLWDEDGSRQEPMAEAKFCVEPTQGSYGVAHSTSGYFWEQTLKSGEWCLDPDASAYKDLLVLEGHYVAPGSKGDAFYYTVYLRPWGKLWDDWYADERECLPSYYESWYLPKLREGVLTLPDKIGS